MASWGPEPGLLASAHGSFPMGSRRVLSVAPATPLVISLRTPVATRVQARCRARGSPELCRQGRDLWRKDVGFVAGQPGSEPAPPLASEESWADASPPAGWPFLCRGLCEGMEVAWPTRSGHLRADLGSSGSVWAALLACSPASCCTDGKWTPRETGPCCTRELTHREVVDTVVGAELFCQLCGLE